MATKTTDPQSSSDTNAAPKKRKREARLDKSLMMTCRVEPAIRARLAEQAAAEGLQLGHFLQKIVETHVIDTAEPGDELVDRISAKRLVIDQITTLAMTLDSEGKFDAHFVLTVMKTAAQDAEFMALYRTAIGGEGRETKLAQKTLNQQLGRLIRRAVGAKGLRSDAGTVARAQTSGEIISSYTLLGKPEA